NNPVSDAKLSATLIPFIGVISNFINIGSGNYVGTYTPPGSIETSTQVDIEVNASISKCIIGSGTIQITVEPQKKLSLRLNTNLEKVTAGRDKAIITATLSDGTNPVTGATLIGSVGAMRGKISEFEDKGNGEYSAEYTPPASVELETKVTIYVSASKYGCISITTSINITVLPQPKLSITLTTTSNTILADLETAIITAHVSNGISPIIDANLVANIEPNIGTISSFEAIGSGNYQAKYTPGDIRNATVLTIYVDGGKYGYINGTANIQISVIPAPDFRVTEEDISFSPAKLIVGKKVTISITIRNIWYGNGTNVKVSVYIDDYPLTPEKSISYISGNGFGTVEYSWKATKGRHTLEVFVDQTNAIKEKNEGNNEALKDFNVKEEQKPTPGYEAIFIILCLIIYVGMSQHCKGTKHL
ncbi:MAG: CARDB domain-containing protein, partial [Candidatus Thermoplasmatota archaeon]